ncbi:hypothetical protein ANN_11818 [Periplaneta americana]|uniref:Uncharacterized protein n=1 Tax=Periplaneta americana TaxID=6978 RepID=A0ABQ8T641_PERAM|nr:hypothetical protein ANN_11818 [Periplaneta americana]
MQKKRPENDKQIRVDLETRPFFHSPRRSPVDVVVEAFDSEQNELDFLTADWMIKASQPNNNRCSTVVHTLQGSVLVIIDAITSVAVNDDIFSRLPYKIIHVDEMTLYRASIYYERITTDRISLDRVQASDLTPMQHSGPRTTLKTNLQVSSIAVYNIMFKLLGQMACYDLTVEFSIQRFFGRPRDLFPFGR